MTINNTLEAILGDNDEINKLSAVWRDIRLPTKIWVTRAVLKNLSNMSNMLGSLVGCVLCYPEFRSISICPVVSISILTASVA